VIFPKITEERFVDEVLGIVHFHFELFENDTLFSFNVFWSEKRLE
jgi:hypothetical protein